MTNVPTHYIHNSHLGVSIGYRFTVGELHLAIAFTHKPGPGFTSVARSKIDQFSRPKGRSILCSRLNEVAEKGGFPEGNAYLFNTPAMDKDQIKYFNFELRDGIHKVLDSTANKYPVSYREMQAADQFDNIELSNEIADVVNNLLNCLV